MTATLTVTTATGKTVVLDDTTGYRVMRDVYGLDAPPVTLNTAARMSSDGAVLVKRRYPVRHMLLPMYINTGSNVRQAFGTLMADLAGPFTLRYEDGDTTRDLIDCYYEGGLEGDDSLGERNEWRKAVVAVAANDPWWYGQANTLILDDSGSVPFDDSIPFDDTIGFDGSTANSVTVEGHGDAFPQLRIDGPYTTLLVGVAGGQSLELAGALADGDYITVDTRPGFRGPARNGGQIDWSLLTPESRLWTLNVGSNTINVASTGTTGNSSVELSWQQRWFTP